MREILHDRIAALDDATAQRLLIQTTEGQRRRGDDLPAPDGQLLEALRAEFGVDDEAGPTIGDGDAARAALLLLATDEQFAAPLEQMIDGPEPESLGIGIVGGALLVGGLIAALQTHIRIERKDDGRWSVKIEKKPTDSKLIAPLLKKLTSLIGV